MSNQALYMEVYHKILNKIQSGEYPENSPLPAERFLCEKYHVSRSTLRAALNLLNKKDIIYTVAGAGSFVRPKYFVQSLNKFYSFGDVLKEEKIPFRNDIISYNLIVANHTLQKKTGHQEGSIFHKIVRLRLADDVPLMVESSYLPQSRFHDLDLYAFVNDSMYEFLKDKYLFLPDRATEKFQAINPIQYEKELLQLYGNIPCIQLERFTYEKEGMVEYTRSVIRGDKYVFSVDLE